MAQDEASRATATVPGEAGRPNFWLIAVLVTAALLALYWFFLRTAYVPVLVNLDPQDAAEIAKVLDAKKIAYRFEAEGRTLAVPEGEADKARIELAGSELPMKGQIGFELFNQSDMGLTEFAQKINYQRALQGELARTILLLDGIQTARVHLGLPERSVFRGEQEQPKASVALILKPGKALSAGTVLGIQRLVAGAVPDMPVDAVAVLDGTGKVISPESAPNPASAGASDAVVEQARQRLVAAIADDHPELKVGVVLSLRYKAEPAASAGATADANKVATGSDELPRRGTPDYAYAVRLTSERPLDDGLRSDLQSTVSSTLGLDPARGDTLVFLVGPILDAGDMQPATVPSDQVVARAAQPQSIPNRFVWTDWWPVIVAAALGSLLAWLAWQRLRRTREDKLAGFTDLLRQRLEAEAGS